MNLLISIINYSAFGLLLIGLISVLKNKFKLRDRCFLVGTILLTVGALLNWIQLPELEIFSFILLFGLQVVANLLQIFSSHEKLNGIVLLVLSGGLCIFFFFTGLFQDWTFFLIAVGTILAGFGYKEPPQHAVRQATLFSIAAVFESFFAYYSNQPFYILLNGLFIFFALFIIRKGIFLRNS